MKKSSNRNMGKGMKQSLLAISLLALGAAAQAQTKTATLVLTQGTKYQRIDGFGGTGMNGQWADVYTQAKVNMLWGQGDDQMGLNIMRIRVNPNESNWGEYGNPIRWARAVNPGLQVFATPWTPPKKYKTHNTEKYQNDFGTWVWPLVEHSWGGEGSNGGAINPDCYADYADFLERFRQTMAAKGCPIDMISIQNESDYTPTGESGEQASYESCIYSPKEMAEMVKAARAAVDPSCKIMGPECFGWDQHKYNNTLVNMADAVSSIDVWGNHLYGTNDWTFVKNVTDKTGKHMWMTEFLIDYDSNYDGSFTAEYPMIESIEKAMDAGYSAYVYYNMLDDFFASNHGGSATQLWKRAYVFSHYAKYATGKTRVRSTLSDSNGKLVGGSSYINDAADTVTVFVLNSSATDTYNLTLGLPFVPARIEQIVTGESVNCKVSDVTEQYANGTRRPRVKLLPGLFYTFQFIKEVAADDEDAALATSPKQAGYGNPLLANRFMADPTAIEYDGRLYVYGTDDQQEFDYSDGLINNSYGHITQLRCISTADMVNWTDHGTIDVKAAAPWIWASWAPSVISREEADGLTHFYLYFTNGAAGIGVLTSTSPTGPWTDPLGHALIDSKTAGLGTISNIIDPGAAIKPDGSEAYLTFGGGDVMGTDLQPGNARIVRLGDDLISLGGDIHTISAPCHFEANELNYIGTRWVYSYCTRWNIASNWSSYSSAAAPTSAAIVYMTATDPLADKWSYKGELVPNPGRMGYPYGNNHSHLQKFGSTYYMLYHTQWLENQLGYSGGYRNLQLNRMTVVEGSARMSALSATTAALTGVGQLSAARINPYEQQTAAMSANTTADWWLVRGVNFGADGAPARSLVLTTRGTGSVEVRLGDLDAEPVATATFSSTEPQELAVPLTEEISGFQTYVYFVGNNGLLGNRDGGVLAWRFSSLDADQAVAIGEVSAAQSADALVGTSFDLSGRRLTSPQQRGFVLQRMADGTVRKLWMGAGK